MSLVKYNNKYATFSGKLASMKYHPELLTYIQGLETPLSEKQLGLLNTFIITLKVGLRIVNLSDAFDVMYVLAGETIESSLRNLVKRSHDATRVNSMAWIALQGFTGNGSSTYLNTNYNPYSQAVNFSQNNSMFGAYSRSIHAAGNRPIIGQKASKNIIMAYVVGNYSRIRINSILTTTVIPSANSQGMFMVGRNSSSSFIGVKNTTVTNLSSTSSSVDNHNFLIDQAYNDDGTLSTYGGLNEVAFAFIGKYLDGTKAVAITNAIEAYMDANGKGVIA